jgi:hypothetical protein
MKMHGELYATVSDQDGSFYKIQRPWPEDATLRVSQSQLYGLEVFILEQYPNYRRFCFDATITVPENIPCAIFWTPGKHGEHEFVRNRFNVRGGGQNYVEAEASAWGNYEAMRDCDHQFHNTCWNLSGDGMCGKCHMFVGGMFMDKRLMDSRNLAYRGHHGIKRKWGGADYIYHPQQVFERVNWWRRDLEPERWLRMGCAAWMHDLLEDCSDPEKEENYITFDQIYMAGGGPAAKLVEELTNPSKQHPDWRREDKKKLDREHCATISQDAKILKFFDRICNLKDLYGWDKEGKFFFYSPSFVKKYLPESALLAEVLRPADESLYQELMKHIESLEKKL